MREFICCCLVWGALAANCLGQPAAVQTDVAPAPTARFPASWYPPESEVTYTQAPLKGAPYIGTMVTTGRYTNPKTGETKTIVNEGLQVRDGAGRTRHDESRPRLSPDGSGKIIDVHEVSVNDPVTHCSFRWEEPWAVAGEPKASVTCMSRRLHYSGSAEMFAAAMKTERTEEHPSRSKTVLTEPLGAESMEGLQATGVKRTLTQTDAEGKVSLIFVSELWYSPVIHELMLMKSSGTSNEETSPVTEYALKRVTAGEPDPKLFYPPAVYTILNGTR